MEKFNKITSAICVAILIVSTLIMSLTNFFVNQDMIKGTMYGICFIMSICLLVQIFNCEYRTDSNEIENNVVKVKRLSPTAQIPEIQTSGSAGADLHADIIEPINILPNETIKIKTGIAIEMPSSDYGAFVFARSGLATKHGIAPANCVGVVDFDYTGEIIVALHNSSDKAYTIQPQERIAQLVIIPVLNSKYVEVKDVHNTKRGSCGFGSTGK